MKVNHATISNNANGQRNKPVQLCGFTSEVVPPADWENERLNIMESVLTAKFEQNPMLMNRLVETGSKLLINGNSKRETYWGVDLYAWVGENQLGKLLTKIREKETRK